MKKILLILVVTVLSALPQLALAVTLGQTDVFEDAGDTEGWGGGDGINVPFPISSTQVSTGGPEGTDDGYLQIGSQNFHLGTWSQVQWTGDYLSAGVGAISMDLNLLAGSSAVQLRILIFGPGGSFASIDRTPPVIQIDWNNYVFGLNASELVHVANGTGVLDDTLAAVTKVLVRHDYPIPTPPSFHPQHITATVGIDNITALSSIPAPAATISKITDTKFKIEWEAVLGRVYQVQATIDLVGWIDIGGSVVATSSLMFIEDDTLQPRKHYRIADVTHE